MHLHTRVVDMILDLGSNMFFFTPVHDIWKRKVMELISFAVTIWCQIELGDIHSKTVLQQLF